MRTSLFAVAVAVTFGLSTKAAATYANTKWGMTPEQVRTACPGGTFVHGTDPVPAYIASMPASGIFPAGSVAFEFDQREGLRSVDILVAPRGRADDWPLTLQTAKALFGAVRNELVERLGGPDYQQAAADSEGMSWVKKEDSLILMRKASTEAGHSEVHLLVTPSPGAVRTPGTPVGYDGIAWGTPLEKVRALRPGGFVRSLQNNGHEYLIVRDAADHDNALITFDFTAGGELSRVTMVFPAGGTRVDTAKGLYTREFVEEAERTFQRVRKILTKKYGTPELDEHDPTHLWWITKGGDMVAMLLLADGPFATVNVQYEPYVRDQSPGF